jgi:anti-anti-sigma factor
MKVESGFTISTVHVGSECRITCAGRIDGETKARLEELLLKTIGGPLRYESILLDLTGMDGIDEGSLRMLRQVEAACSRAEMAMQTKLAPEAAALGDGAV